MGELRDRMDADLRLAGYSPRTQKCHVARVKAFAKRYMRSPAEFGRDRDPRLPAVHGVADYAHASWLSTIQPVPRGARRT